MIKAIISDFSRVILFPKDREYSDSLNDLNKNLSGKDNYNALEHFYLNQELLDYYKKLQEKDIKIYLFTSENIQERPEFKKSLENIFSGIFSSSKLNLDKNASQSYEKILSRMELNPTEVVYVDDTMENVRAAEIAGLIAIVYQNTADIIRFINEKINWKTKS